MTTDATGQEIIINEYYGYSKSNNGSTWIVTGSAVKAENGKVTLTDITEKLYTCLGEGNMEPSRVVKTDRKRTLSSVQVFHISKHLMVDKNAPKHDCYDPFNRVADGMLYRCAICKTIL